LEGLKGGYKKRKRSIRVLRLSWMMETGRIVITSRLGNVVTGRRFSSIVIEPEIYPYVGTHAT
jgi:hypothetical protein